MKRTPPKKPTQKGLIPGGTYHLGVSPITRETLEATLTGVTVQDIVGGKPTTSIDSTNRSRIKKDVDITRNPRWSRLTKAQQNELRARKRQRKKT